MLVCCGRIAPLEVKVLVCCDNVAALEMKYTLSPHPHPHPRHPHPATPNCFPVDCIFILPSCKHYWPLPTLPLWPLPHHPCPCLCVVVMMFLRHSAQNQPVDVVVMFWDRYTETVIIENWYVNRSFAVHIYINIYRCECWCGYSSKYANLSTSALNFFSLLVKPCLHLAP